jgi:hypothetical protein
MAQSHSKWLRMRPDRRRQDRLRLRCKHSVVGEAAATGAAPGQWWWGMFHQRYGSDADFISLSRRPLTSKRATDTALNRNTPPALIGKSAESVPPPTRSAAKRPRDQAIVDHIRTFCRSASAAPGVMLRYFERLLVAQRRHRIDFGGATGEQVARE